MTGLDQIAAADPSFSGKDFLQGGRGAYEMIIAAFAKGDRGTLTGLLAKDVFDGFSAAMTERESRGETVRNTFVSIDKGTRRGRPSPRRDGADHRRLRVQQINETLAKDGTPVEGSSGTVGHVIDRWSFARGRECPRPQLEARRHQRRMTTAAVRTIVAPRAAEDAAAAGWAEDDLAAAWAVFRHTAVAALVGSEPLRPAKPIDDALRAVFLAAVALPEALDNLSARRFFEQRFVPTPLDGPGFLTGYYEPVVAGSSVRSTDFDAPFCRVPTIS